jgi:hypothetical protein
MCPHPYVECGTFMPVAHKILIDATTAKGECYMTAKLKQLTNAEPPSSCSYVIPLTGYIGTIQDNAARLRDLRDCLLKGVPSSPVGDVYGERSKALPKLLKGVPSSPVGDVYGEHFLLARDLLRSTAQAVHLIMYYFIKDQKPEETNLAKLLWIDAQNSVFIRDFFSTTYLP